jgi:3-isopropylmalate/(R)-2-methylmalate dehydratase small subunit
MPEFQWVLRGRCYKLGHDVPHPGGVIPARFITAREMDPTILMPQLFAETDPGFPERSRPGDIIVTGRNFGMGPKGNGYVAMHGLGLGLLCESMSVQAYRAAISTGLRVLNRCANITDDCETGNDLEVDFLTGDFINHTTGLKRVLPPVPEALRELVAHGGNEGWLKHWWVGRGQPKETGGGGKSIGSGGQ